EKQPHENLPRWSVTFRTLDMEKDKLKDMISIADAVGFALDDEGQRYRYVTSARPVLYGVPFYFEDIKGREIIRTQLRALMRACVDSKKKNIRITIPMVENEEQASLIKDLVASIRSELAAEGVDKAELDKVRFGAMIETPAACAAVPEILREGSFSYISIGTNDLSKRSYSDSYERDDERLEKIYHVLFPAFVRNVRTALHGLNDYNRHAPPARRAEACICGEWANSRKFLFYILSLLDTLKFIEVSMVVKSHKVGELKEYLRYVTGSESADEVMSGEINDSLSTLSDRVSAQIRLARDVEGRKARRILEEASGNPPAWRRAIKNALSQGIFIAPFYDNGDKFIVSLEGALLFLSIAIFVWFSVKFARNAYYSYNAESLRAEIMSEYSDLAFNPRTGRSRTADAIKLLADPMRIPPKYSLPALKDIILHSRSGRMIASKTLRLPVNVYALFAMYENM
nr:aldolase/citrate lyase family protein [Candidatus Omnitrophota bacterium]